MTYWSSSHKAERTEESCGSTCIRFCRAAADAVGTGRETSKKNKEKQRKKVEGVIYLKGKKTSTDVFLSTTSDANKHKPKPRGHEKAVCIYSRLLASLCALLRRWRRVGEHPYKHTRRLRLELPPHTLLSVVYAPILVYKSHITPSKYPTLQTEM